MRSPCSFCHTYMGYVESLKRLRKMLNLVLLKKMEVLLLLNIERHMVSE